MRLHRRDADLSSCPAAARSGATRFAAAARLAAAALLVVVTPAVIAADTAPPAAAGAASSATATEGGFDREALAAYVRAHGDVAAPRMAAYSGTVYDVPSGRVLATLDGWQVARAFPGGTADPEAWYIVRRAFLLYRAPDDGRILAYYPDVRARSAPVPALSITRYALRGDRVVASTVGGVRGKTQAYALPEQVVAAREDDAWVFRRVISPPDPQQKPIEVTEIVYVDPARDRASRIRFAMTKVAENWGFLPAGGRHLLHLAWRPVADLAAAAPVIRDLLAREAPAALATLPASLEAAHAELGLAREASLPTDR